MLNILTEPLIRMTTVSGTHSASLPRIYAALMADEAEAFPALRPHQRHAWHAFLVQLGAMAMHRAGVSDPPRDVAEWVELIRALTPEFPDDEPWQLVVEDITKPAFMQPPARSAAAEVEYGTKPAKRGKQTIRVPDEDKIVRYADGLDMLVTSKNHDLKAAVASQAGVDDWIFALITLQTMEGYGGARNYGISRMPSGYGNRPAFSITPSARPGGHIGRDIAALLQHRHAILEEYPVIDGGIGLPWVKAWDGTKAEALLINQMEPFYIDVCRRVRLRQGMGGLKAVKANSLARRIADTKGLTGDPWAPVGKSTNQNATPPAFLGLRKFGYERVVDGLFSSDWSAPPLLTLASYDRRADGSMQLVARGMVRGEGGTAGYHERIIPLKPKTAQVFGRDRGVDDIADIARARVAQIGKVKTILRHAIATFAAHGESNDTSSEQRARANPWSDRLDEIVDASFFDDLQEESDADDSAERKRIRNHWLRNGKDGVVDHAARILTAAEDALSCLSIHRYKARVRADGVFWGRLAGANGLPELFDRGNTGQEGKECPNNDQPTAPSPIPTEAQMTLFT